MSLQELQHHHRLFRLAQMANYLKYSHAPGVLAALFTAVLVGVRLIFGGMLPTVSG